MELWETSEKSSCKIVIYETPDMYCLEVLYLFHKQADSRLEGIIGGDGEIIYYHHDNWVPQDWWLMKGEVAWPGLPALWWRPGCCWWTEPVNEVNEGYKYTAEGRGCHRALLLRSQVLWPWVGSVYNWGYLYWSTNRSTEPESLHLCYE